MKKFVAGILAAALVAALVVLVAFWPFGNNKVLIFPGIVEIQEVRLGSKVGGRVAQVKVQEGMTVQRKQELVVFEKPELENLREQLRARLQQAQAECDRIVYGAREEEKRAAQAAADAAKARYDKMREGWREEEKRWAKSDLDTADAELRQALDEFMRIAELYRKKNASRSEYDAALGARDRARGRAEAARAKYEMYQLGHRKEEIAEAHAEWQQAQAKADELANGSREEDKALARARVAEARAKLQEVEIQLAETIVTVPDAEQFNRAVVEVVAVRPGDIVPPGQPIVRVLCAQDLWVKIFVPETKLGLVPIDTAAEVTIDSHPDRVFPGKVMQRAAISEFTPRNVQSVDERRHQVFGVKVFVDDPQGILHAGMAATVKIRLKE
ncbi:MAG: efflux RND transporter periplasmic adaptor subunit [Gemmataceae bacterium]|nr:efflux RND transporter periplasmic adaptor subunit [Gemmataceae bacterium]